MIAIDTSALLAIFKGESDGAAWLASALATTDRGYIRTYFPRLKLLAP